MNNYTGKAIIIPLLASLFLFSYTPLCSAEILEYITPSKNSSPVDLVFDSKGILWFTEINTN
ncbi:MAG: Lyase-like protein, partial [Nitrospirota bacterium]